MYSGEDDFDLPENSSGLFEAVNTPEAGEVPAPGVGVPQAQAVMMEESVDMPSSGLSIGLCIGALVAMIIILIILASELEGSASMLTSTIAGNLWVWTGGLAVERQSPPVWASSSVEPPTSRNNARDSSSNSQVTASANGAPQRASLRLLSA